MEHRKLGKSGLNASVEGVTIEHFFLVYRIEKVKEFLTYQ